MTVPAEQDGVVRELFPEGEPRGTLRAHARVCAVEPEPEEVSPGVPSLPSRLRARAEQARSKAGAQAAAIAGKPGTLLHAQPMTFHEAHLRHLECAGHYRHRPVRGARICYGVVHNVTVKPALNYIEWATASPLGLLIHAVLGFAVWLGLSLGGYL
jgi:hypothetical protein